MPSPRSLLSARSLLIFILALPVSYLFTTALLGAVYLHFLLRPGCPLSTGDGYGISSLQSIQLETSEGLTLKGWFHPPENGTVILLLGGLDSGRDTMLPRGRMLAAHGFGFITLDPRPCAGKPSTLGFKEASVIDVMLDYALRQPGVERAGALGFSVGGTAVVLGSVDQPAIQAVVTEGNFANLHQEITYKPSTIFSPLWCVQRWVVLFYRIEAGVWPAFVSPIDSLAGLSPRPILLIHGELEADRTHALDQFAAAGENSTLWLVPAAPHGAYYHTDPREYEQRVVAFFNQAFFSRDSTVLED